MSPFSWLKKKQVAPKPEGFVIYGSMRTGSNYLVSLLNQLPGIICHGEAFNPAFVEISQDYSHKLGLKRSDHTARDADLWNFYRRILQPPPGGLLCGFKLFARHSPPVMKATLGNPNVLKILLTRDPLSTFISLCQAEASGVWMIRDVDTDKLTTQRKKSDMPIEFNGPRFMRFAAKMEAFHRRVETAARSSRSRLLVLDYTALNEPNTLLNLASFLGTTVGSIAEEKLLKKQNLSSVHDKVINLEEMIAFLEANRLTESPIYADAKASQ
jgi:hypothetical protein